MPHFRHWPMPAGSPGRLESGHSAPAATPVQNSRNMQNEKISLLQRLTGIFALNYVPFVRG
jgi:hypothetical protein